MPSMTPVCVEALLTLIAVFSLGGTAEISKTLTFELT